MSEPLPRFIPMIGGPFNGCIYEGGGTDLAITTPEGEVRYTLGRDTKGRLHYHALTDEERDDLLLGRPT